MSKSQRVMDVIWQVVKFILTLGLSHIAKRDERRSKEQVNGDSH